MKKFSILLVVASLCCIACVGNNKALYPKPKGAVRLLQYNVGAFSKYITDSTCTEMIAAMIRELDADIVSLNETDSCNRRHNKHQCEDLSQALGGWAFTFGRAMPYKDGAYGNGIVCKGEMTPAGLIALDKGEGHEPRCAVICETPDYVFLSAHLDHKNHEASINQARQLTAAVRERYAGCGKPVFLAGDMNATPDNEVITILQQDWDIISVTGESTFPCPNSRICIDYIFALKNGCQVKVLGTAVARRFLSGDVETASDHYPIFVDIAL